MNKRFLFLISMIILVVGLTACGEKKTNSSGDQDIVDVIPNSGKENKGSKPSNNQKETDPYVANIPNEILDFYKEKIEELEEKNKEYNKKLLEENPDMDITSLNNLKYDLVFFDDNNTPELVVDKEGYQLSLYTYDAGKVIYALDDENEEGWPYGAGGNAGYEYVPRENVLRNYNSDFAGLVRYVNFYNLNSETHKITPINIGELIENYYEDKNENGKLDEDEMDTYSEEPFYIIGSRRATKEQWEESMIKGDYEPLAGTKSGKEILKLLDGLINEK